MLHSLKIAPDHFAGQVNGTKTFELRLNDRDFQVGDVLALQEYAHPEYTGRNVKRYVVGLLRGPVLGLADGWVILSTSAALAQKGGQV